MAKRLHNSKRVWPSRSTNSSSIARRAGVAIASKTSLMGCTIGKSLLACQGPGFLLGDTPNHRSARTATFELQLSIATSDRLHECRVAWVTAAEKIAPGGVP